MTGTPTPQTKDSKPSVQLTNEDKKTFEKKEHQLIYRAFLDTLEDPEKQTQQEINKIREERQEKLSEQEKEKLQRDLQSLVKLLGQLQSLNENEKKIFTFTFENSKDIFKNVDPEDIKSLSEENFLQFLISVFEKIREKNLASGENLENGEIGKIVKGCVVDIRGTEAKDSLIKLIGLPLGIKIDPKNISGSFMSGLKEKIPFLGGGKEKDEPPLSDKEMATTFLRKSLLPVALFAFTTLIFGTSPIMLSIAVVGLLVTEVNAVKSLFSNNRKGTLYNPNTEKEKEWGSEISDGINTILETPVKRVEKGTPVSEQNSQGKEKSEQQPVPEKVSQKNEKSEQQPNPMLEKISVGPQAENTGRQPT
uniref:Uncharacterized protein n=1 Tax=Glossina austeni TaxID=7395 RepID=A0A1A9VK68_GLOAU